MNDPIADLSLDRLLLATDWRDGSERLHRQAAQIARLFDAEVIVVTAFDPPVPLRIKRAAPGAAEYRRELENEAKETAADVTAEMLGYGLRAQGIAGEGNAADVILQIAEQEDADLIVLGSGGGRSHVRDYLVGSTAERVVRYAQVPVYVFK